MLERGTSAGKGVRPTPRALQASSTKHASTTRDDHCCREVMYMPS